MAEGSAFQPESSAQFLNIIPGHASLMDQSRCKITRINPLRSYINQIILFLGAGWPDVEYLSTAMSYQQVIHKFPVEKSHPFGNAMDALPGASSCVQNAGDVVILPGGWWHDTCSAAGGSMVLTF